MRRKKVTSLVDLTTLSVPCILKWLGIHMQVLCRCVLGKECFITQRIDDNIYTLCYVIRILQSGDILQG